MKEMKIKTDCTIMEIITPSTKKARKRYFYINFQNCNAHYIMLIHFDTWHEHSAQNMYKMHQSGVIRFPC